MRDLCKSVQNDLVEILLVSDMLSIIAGNLFSNSIEAADSQNVTM